MQIRVEKSKIDQRQTAMLGIGVYEGEHDFAQSKELDPTLVSHIKQSLEAKEFQGKAGTSMLFPTLGKGPMSKILLIGLGKREKFSDEVARVSAAKVAAKAKELGLREFSILQFSNLDEGLIEAMTEGICLSQYSFDRYKAKGEDASVGANGQQKQKVEEATILVNSESPRSQSVADRASLVSDAVNYSRDLGNMPPNDCPPAYLASTAISTAAECGMKTRIIERYEMESMGMGGIIAVGKGSDNAPKLIIMEYSGSTSLKPYLLVGKAVTFDTGGISIKPGDKMDEMKFDKCGGSTVLAIMRAIASMKLPINVVGIVAAVENMPSGSAYRPGDIVRMYNGKTVEVLNTDAEGRMILGDAIAYGIATYNPRAVIDFATLTGAAIIALGSNVAAMIGNNKPLLDRLKKCAEKTGEKVWELPLYDEFHDQIKSTFADIKNVGGRPGGAITAAAFLSNFVSNTPWVHLDIAGTAWTQDGTFERAYNPKGATGFGVRTIIKLLAEDEKQTPQ